MNTFFGLKANQKKPIITIQKKKKFEHTPLQSKYFFSHHFVPPTNGIDFVASKEFDHDEA